MSEELKPCPFCGGEAEIRPVTMPDGNVRQYVSCLNDSCGAASGLFGMDCYAVDAWNRRAERTCRIEYGPSAVFRNETGPDWTTQDFVARCSGCGHRMHQDPFTGKWPRYCPNCGARVVKDE